MLAAPMSPMPLAAVQVENPLFWALFIGWVLSVILHEFAHGVVAYLGGDYTIRERGGLSLNPLQYVDPVMSLILPVIFLLMGGVPLPGGATYVRTDLLRNRYWSSAVSAAGPAMNLLLFLALALLLNPRVGWLPPHTHVLDWSPAQRLVAALAYLQLWAALLNLIPVPPLDGFGILSPHLKPETRERLTRGPMAIGALVMLFLLISTDKFVDLSYRVMQPVIEATGLDFHRVLTAARLLLFGTP